MRLKRPCIVLTGMLLVSLSVGIAVQPAWPLMLTAPGFDVFFPTQSGLTGVRGFVVFPSLIDFIGFHNCYYFVEQALNRVSASCGGTTVHPLATGLSTPTDIVGPPSDFQCPFPNPFGSFLYVTESGANKISRIDVTGCVPECDRAVTTFATFTSPPRRMAMSLAGPPPYCGQVGSAFGTLLFVTLADGQIVKVDPDGVVSPCVSGLQGPEGLVFGPGGEFYKTVLFVAESTANRISRVDPDCKVSPFASTGLSGPIGLAISPGGGWGPADMLYVVNASTRVDRVDTNGNVTGFAEGLMQGGSVHFPKSPAPPNPLGSTLHFYISDTARGTLEEIAVNSPTLELSLAACNPCKAGDTFAVRLTVENASPIQLPVEVKAGFRLPDGTPVNFAPDLGNDKHFETVLPQGFKYDEVFLSITVPPVPPGRYCYEIGMTDPELLGSNIFRGGVSRDGVS